jgi:hypothetical protein
VVYCSVILLSTMMKNGWILWGGRVQLKKTSYNSVDLDQEGNVEKISRIRRGWIQTRLNERSNVTSGVIREVDYERTRKASRILFRCLVYALDLDSMGIRQTPQSLQDHAPNAGIDHYHP